MHITIQHDTAGIEGDSNTMCYDNSSAIAGPRGAINAACSVGSDCLHGVCTSNVCTAPILQCPTTVPGRSTSFTQPINRNFILKTYLLLLLFFYSLGSICSGNGACIYSDPSGNNLTSCTIFEYRCRASCACTNGFSGKECTLSSTALIKRNSVRCVLCYSITWLHQQSLSHPVCHYCLVTQI